MLSACVAVVLELSFTCTVKLAVPVDVGVPLMVPFAASASPAGTEPVVVDHVYPPLPPVAPSDWLYGAPVVPTGNEETVICSGGLLTTMVSAWVSVALEESVTCAVKLKLPVALGVPVMAPAVDKVSPPGRDPMVFDHLFPPVPPLAVRVWL
jgi:hypothetical protein